MRFMQMQYAIALSLCLAFASLTSGEENNKQKKIHEKIDGKPSPDGSMVLFTRYDYVDGKTELDTEIFVEKVLDTEIHFHKVLDTEIYTARSDGSQLRRLTDNDKMDESPDWSPDGKRIVFTSDRSGQFQVHSMDFDGKNVRQMTTEKQGVGKTVKYGPDGRIAYLALHEPLYKLGKSDLILMDGDKSKTVARAMEITDFAWHPDGNSVVYAVVGRFVFHDLANDAKTVVQFLDIDKRLDAHGAFDIRWRPDKDSITCRIGSIRGKFSGSPKEFGDDEQFIITRAGKASWSIVDKR